MDSCRSEYYLFLCHLKLRARKCLKSKLKSELEVNTLNNWDWIDLTPYFLILWNIKNKVIIQLIKNKLHESKGKWVKKVLVASPSKFNFDEQKWHYFI